MAADLTRVCLACLALLTAGLTVSFLTRGQISEAIEHAGCPRGDRCLGDNWRGAACHCHAPCDSDPWWP